jgi:hypothetical protein
LKLQAQAHQHPHKAGCRFNKVKPEWHSVVGRVVVVSSDDSILFGQQWCIIVCPVLHPCTWAMLSTG